jgi:3'(2'), 5'-bisphosphate nucleotidase
VLRTSPARAPIDIGVTKEIARLTLERTMTNLKDLLPELVTLSRAAGREILAVYNSNFEVQHKADQSPLTQADLRAHTTLVNGLQALTPHIPILSEEASEIPYGERSRWSSHWLVDPLDGTREFVSRNGEFTVNVALIEQHRPVLGVVHVPTQDVTFSGLQQLGAFKQIAAASPIRIQTQRPATQPLRIVSSRSHAAERADEYQRILGPYTLVKVGSSLKFCIVAEGAADLYPRFGNTSEWDTAAGQAVLEAAGGIVVDLQGRSLRYNTRAELLNPHFIAFADDSRDWCKLLQPAP